ncbi:MAG: ornithine cyclodeaminase family protein, partial [Chloroflexota bacterium]
NDIRQIIHHIGLDTLMDEMIDRLTVSIEMYDEEKTVVPPRSGFQYTQPHLGLIEWMPVMESGETVTVKTVGYHPANPTAHKLPTILSTVCAYDTKTGHLIGIADATFLTALRTGAASAIASRFMAHPESKTIGLIGAGAQAMTQLHALTRCYSINTVFVYDSDPNVSNSFLERAAFLGVNLVQVSEQTNVKQIIQSSDIICTATSVGIGHGPVFEDTTTKPWLHINAVGADFPGKVEIPLSFLKRSIICPDFPAQAVLEGECQQLDVDDIGPSLIEVVQNPVEHHYIQGQTSVFDSTGWAVEDQIAMTMMIDYAKQYGLGATVQIESSSNDPHNPYQFVTQSHYTATTLTI